MDHGQFRRAIRETLLKARRSLYSPAVENLLFGTAAHESGGFKYIWQINGPALGYFQMEPATIVDLHDNFLAFKPGLLRILENLRPRNKSREDATVYCLDYAILAARLQYLRFPEAIPDAHDIEAMAALYKLRWNTPLGKATEQNFIDAYETHTE